MILLQHSLIFGLILSALLMGVLFATRLLMPTVSAGGATTVDTPEANERRQRKKLLGPVLLVIGGTLMAAVWALPSTGLAVTFGTVFACAFLVAFVFNLVDLLLIDWLLVVAWHPSWFIPPGTTGAVANRSYGFHFKGFFKGLGFCLMAALLTASLNGLLTGRW
jgi:hypothetical protein